MADVEKSLDIILRARDKASGQIKGFGKQVGSSITGSLAKVAGTVIAVEGAFAAAGKAVLGFTADTELAAARQKGSAADMLEAQAKVGQAWADTGRALPLIGELVGNIMATMSDVEGLRKQAAELKKLDQTYAAIMNKVAAIRRENKLLAAELAGADKFELERIRLGFGAEDQQKQIEALEGVARKKRELEGRARRELEQTQREIREARERGDKLAWAVAMAAAQDQADLWAKFRAEQIKADQDLADARDVIAKNQADKERKRQQDLAEHRKNMGEKQVQEEKAQSEKHKRDEDEAMRKLAADIEKQRRDQEQKLARQHKAAEERTRTQQQLQLDILRSVGKEQEAAMLAAHQQYQKLREQFAGDAEMKRMIDLAERLEIDKIKRGAEKPKDRGGPVAADAEAVASRFLRHAPGRESPAWAQALERGQDKQTNELKQKLDQLGPALKVAFREAMQDVIAVGNI